LNDLQLGLEHVRQNENTAKQPSVTALCIDLDYFFI